MRTRIPGIMRAVGSMPWAIVPEKLSAVLDMLELRASGVAKSDEEIQAVVAARRGASVAPSSGKIAVLPLFGVISQRANMMSDISGGTSCEQFASSFDAAMANSDVGAIVIDCDSPGGSVNGVPELAARIREARGKGKKIIAVANSLMASAAYWVCAQADEVVVTPSGDVGSIGVFMCHTDESAADEQAGIKRTMISAGKYKTEGNPYEALSDDARAALQAQVDEFYGMFTADVALGRGVKVAAVENGFGEGRVLTAKQAVKAKLADRVATLEDVLAELGATNAGVNGRSRAAEAQPLHLAASLSPDNASLLMAASELRALKLLASDDDITPREDARAPFTVSAGGAADMGSIPPASHRPTKAKEHTVENTPAAHGADPSVITAAVDAALARRDAQNKAILALCGEHGIDATHQADILANAGGDMNAAAAHILNIKKTLGANSPIIRVGAEREAEQKFANAGEQLVAIIQRTRTGKKDARLDRVNFNAGSPLGVNESVGSEGGFFIAPEVLPDIFKPAYTEDPILSRVKRIPIGDASNRTVYNVVDESARTDGNRWGGVQFSWADEADTGTAKKPKMRQVEQLLKKLIGIAYLTDEMLQDAPAAQSLVMEAFQTELQFTLANAVFRGKGGGQMVGFLNGRGGVAQAIESTQTIANTNTFISQNVSKMKANVPAALWGDLIWLYNQELLPALMNATIGSTSIPVFVPAAGMAGQGSVDRILGAPAFASELCEQPGTVGDIICIAPSQYHMAEKGGVQVAQSVHVQFLSDQTALRFTQRVDGKPVWNTTVTPFKGANARGFFSTLNTRS